MSEEICPHCNQQVGDHDYEHLARRCFPSQIKALRKALEAIGAYCGRPITLVVKDCYDKNEVDKLLLDISEKCKEGLKK